MKKCENPLIPEITKTYTKRTFNLSDIKLPSDIKKACVWCLGPLKGAQRRWCSEECVDSASAWGSPQKEYGLGFLLIRQNFKCNTCAFDWGTVIEKMYSDPNPYISVYGMKESKDTWRVKFSYWVVKKLKRYMHMNNKSHCLEVDHVVPIYKGGLSLDFDNLQCICYTCHKVKTKQDLSGKRSK